MLWRRLPINPSLISRLNLYSCLCFVLVCLYLAGCSTLPKHPYERHKKPVPEGVEWSSLLPPTIGNYQRLKIHFPTDKKDGTVYYKQNKNVILVSFNKLENMRAMKMYLVDASQDISRTPEWKQRHVRTSGDKKHVCYHQADKSFFAWNRGLYYFDVFVVGKKPVLDEFMNVFPY